MITKKEALIYTVLFPLPDTAITKVLIDRGLDGDAQYTMGDAKDIDLCMAGLLFSLLTAPDEVEGDWSVKLPSRELLLKSYSALVTRWGEKDEFAPGKPTVRGRMPW